MTDLPGRRRLTVLVLAVAAAAVLIAACAAAQDKAPPDPLGVSQTVRQQLQTFFERYAHVAPDRKIVLEPDWREPPVGLKIVRARIDSSDERFEEGVGSFLTADHKHVFIGQSLKLGVMPEKVLGPSGPMEVSKEITDRAGFGVDVTWGTERGPGGTRIGKLEQMTDAGRVEMPAYLTADGKWLLVGTFYPLDRDPREVRMERLDLDRLPGTGPENAPVVIVEFSDYQCPSCGKHQVDIDEALAKYPGKIRLYHVDHPIVRIHPWAFPAAAGSRCVEKMVGEKAYWQYKKAIYQRQKDITAENLDDISAPIVESLGADVAAWRKCRDEDASIRAAILGDLKMSNQVGVHGTPTLFVNGTLVDLGIDEVLDTAIRRALAGK